MKANFIKNNTPDKKVIFIVEDNEAYAKLLQVLIRNRFPKIKEIKIFSIGELCLTEMHRNPYIVIMDYFLNTQYDKAQNGLEIIKQIKAQRPLTNIVVLSAQKDYNVVLEAIRQYDCLYVQKDLEAFTKIELFLKEILENKSALTYKQSN